MLGGRVEGGDERAAVDEAEDVGSDEGPVAGVVAVAALPRRGVANRGVDQVRAGGDPFGGVGDEQFAAQVPAPTHEPVGRAVGLTERHDRLVLVEVEPRDGLAAAVADRHRGLDHPFLGVIEADVGLLADRDRADGDRSGGVEALDRAAHDLQEPEAEPHRRGPGRLEDQIDGHRRRFAHAIGVRTGRSDDSPLPPDPVLVGRRPVRVEDVALVEDGVGDGPGRGERVDSGHDGPCEPASRPVRSWSQLGMPSAPLRTSRAWMVSRWRRIQPTLGW